MNRPRVALSELPGVQTGRVFTHRDPRGSFSELWRESWLAKPDGDADSGSLRFVQANRSTSDAGVLRGIHLHRRQSDLWALVDGRAFVALVDLRATLAGTGDSPTVATGELLPDDWLLIPPGIGHGFLALDALELIYLVSAEYDPHDELGMAWDDADLGIDWPRVTSAKTTGVPLVSERDSTNPSLAEFIARLRV